VRGEDDGFHKRGKGRRDVPLSLIDLFFFSFFPPPRRQDGAPRGVLRRNLSRSPLSPFFSFLFFFFPPKFFFFFFFFFSSSGLCPLGAGRASSCRVFSSLLLSFPLRTFFFLFFFPRLPRSGPRGRGGSEPFFLCSDLFLFCPRGPVGVGGRSPASTLRGVSVVSFPLRPLAGFGTTPGPRRALNPLSPPFSESSFFPPFSF